MKSKLLISVIVLLMVTTAFGQKNSYFKEVSKTDVISINKNVLRETFPDDFKLYQIDVTALKNTLFLAEDRFKPNANSVIISLPNADGGVDTFKIFEASNFTPELQKRFPNIRAYIGTDMANPSNTLRLSFGEMGIQTMAIKSNGQTEFLEAYSTDNSIYAAFKAANRKPGKLPFTCSTNDLNVANDAANKTNNASTSRSSVNKLLTFRAAQSCTGEYANYFGATSSAQEGLVISAFNATYTRVNGVYEKDLAISLSLISAPSIIFYNAATDPYSPGTNLANWNAELENTLQSNVGDDAFDVGHLFGASGGGGNAGCIGCVCDPSVKGRGITSPGANSGPTGDKFDIDYVAHEFGHQFGGNHTFSHNNEASGVNVEPGSGSTIMAYAGITSQNVQNNSDDYFHIASIIQIQNNMVNKTCPTVTDLTNTAPVVNAGLDYTIPKSTPFILLGSATDNTPETLTYTWEQYNSAGSTQTGAASVASATKATGPNWKSYTPTISPLRYFPNINSVVANSATTLGTATSSNITVEALSSVARTLQFVLTARDNTPNGGLTNFDNTIVTVNATAGPFLVTSPNNAGLTWAPGSVQTVTWDVAGTTANGVNCSSVSILMSTDGGYTYTQLLASNVPNDGSETISVPNVPNNNTRIMVKGHNQIFFDISNNNLTVAAPTSTFGVAYNGGVGNQTKELCNGSSTTFVVKYEPVAGFNGTTTFSATGIPAGTSVSFNPTSMTASGDVIVTVNATSAAAGINTIVVNGTSGATTKAVNLYVDVKANLVAQTLTTPANNTNPTATSVTLNWAVNAGATSYDYEIATDVNFTQIVFSGNTNTSTYTVSGLLQAVSYYWRIKPKNSNCAGSFSTPFKFRTGGTTCATPLTNNTVVNVPDGTAANTPPTTFSSKTITVPATSGFVNKIETTLTITHTYVQDLIVELLSPDGTIVPLISRKCDNGSINGGGSDPANSTYAITFSDDYTPLANGPCITNPGGTTILNAGPTSPLNVFIGKASAGNWTLRARDWFNGDTGSLKNWSLTVCTATLGSNSFNEIEGLKVYPNPNNGSFTINFTPESDKTSVLVHDIRGRQIFENNYNNNGLFNQNIDLNNAESGIYLVTITDGAKKVTKKIVVE